MIRVPPQIVLSTGNKSLKHEPVRALRYWCGNIKWNITADMSCYEWIPCLDTSSVKASPWCRPLRRWNRGVISSVSRSAAGRIKHGAGIITGLADSWWQSMSKCWSLAQRGLESSALHSIWQFWAVFLRLITVQTCNHLLYTFQGISTHPVEIHCYLTVAGLWFTVLYKYESPTQWMSLTGTSIKQLPQSGSFPWAFVELWSAERFSEELAK